MKVCGITAGRVNLHSIFEILAEEIAVIGGDDHLFYAEIRQNPKRTTQLQQHLVHPPPRVRDIVSFSERVNLL